MSRKISLIILLLLLSVSGAWAQDEDTGDDDTTTATTGDRATIDIFGVLCEDRIVVDISGFMTSGNDVFFQVFSGTQGSGTALTDLRQVQVDGTYSVSDTVQYSGGTLPANTTGSFYFAIANQNDASDTVFSDFADDLQDGCREPGNQVVNSQNTGTTTQAVPSTGTTQAVSTTGATTTTTTGRARNVEDGVFVDTGTSAILSPFGGYINPDYSPGGPVVEIGPTENDPFGLPRQTTPGLVFAECEDYPVAEPGIIYDNDNVIFFWSWFTATEAQMQDHLENVNYDVQYYDALGLPNVQRTDIRFIEGLYWVFYYSELGNLFPGRYFISYKVTWDEPVFDGFSEYGPGTDNDLLVSACEFQVFGNPSGEAIDHNDWPLNVFN
jgi:hypothetical protein